MEVIPCFRLCNLVTLLFRLCQASLLIDLLLRVIPAVLSTCAGVGCGAPAADGGPEEDGTQAQVRLPGLGGEGVQST
jgi:hypothetical protein